jgi:hypothetical protein
MSRMVDEFMNQPVSLGGFTFSWGFVYTRFGKGQEKERDWTLIAARHHEGMPDVRGWPKEEQVALWAAITEGNTQAVNAVYQRNTLA